MALGRLSLVFTFLLLYLHPSYQIRYCGSNSGMEVWRGHCYYFSYPMVTYQRAKTLCENMGAVVVSIHSAEEAQFIHKKMDPTTYTDYWIGLERDTENGTFKWADGTALDYQNWGVGRPGSKPYDCVEAEISDLTWRDSSCTASSEYVCKAKAVDGWQEYNNYEYFISGIPEETESTWYEARDFCMRAGGDLASTLTSAEVIQVAKWAGLNQYDGPLWIGLNKLAGRRDAWGWSDDSGFSSSWNNWKRNFPIDEKYGHLCGYQDSNDSAGKWINGHCDAKKGFICKRPKTASPTPKTTQPTPSVGGYCPAGYSGFGNKCFKVVLVGDKLENALTFEKALVKCRQEPGVLPSLASISSELEQAYLSAHLNNIGLGVWIGLRRPLFGAAWTWVDSSPNNYQHWAPDKPEERKGGHCAEMWMILGSVGEWNNVECHDKRGYVCQTYKDAGNIIPTSGPPLSNLTCPAGFTPYWYGCFKYQELMLTYERAQEECTKLHPAAKLVSIHAEAENAAIQTWVIRQNSDAWIGFRDDGDASTGGEYKWDDGWMVFYVNWANGQPAKDDGGGCVYMSEDGEWRDTNCEVEKASVCKISQIPPITTPPTMEGRCPSGTGWFEYHEHCYLIMPNERKNWASAKKNCQEQGFLSSLASIHAFTENQMIFDKLKGMDAERKSLWIGLYRSAVDRSRLKWADGSSLQYEAWAPGEPNGEEGEKEDCVEMFNEHWPARWNDHNCADLKGYVCKAPKSPVITLPTLSPHCDPGWHYRLLTGDCYLFQPDNLHPWQTAQAICESQGADIVSIHGPFENLYVEKEMKLASTLPTTGFVYYWIGLKAYKDAVSEEYAFKWTDDSEYDYEHWSVGEPIRPEYYQCVYADRADGRWGTQHCESNSGFACKKQGKATQKPEIGGNAGLSGGQVAGVVIGVLLGVILLAFIVVAVLTHKQVIDNPVNKISGLGMFSRSSSPPTVDSTISYEKQP